MKQSTADSTERLAVFRQYLVAVAASSSFIMVGVSYAWPSPVLPHLLNGDCALHLTTEEASWVVSILCLGSLLSPFPAGYLADKFGRQMTLLGVGLLPVVSWLLVLFTTSVAGLCVARVLLGMHLGALATVLPVYIGEISQPSVRGSLNTLNNLFFNLGSLIVFVVGPLLSYETLAAFSLSMSIAFLVLVLVTPESPYYTIRNQEDKKTLTTLLWLRGNPNSTDLKIYKELAEIKKSVQTKSSTDRSLAKILNSKASKKALGIGLVYSAGKRISGEGAMKTYVTVTLPDNTFGVLTPNDCALILGIITLLSSLLLTHVSDYFGRKTIAASSFLGSGISNLAVAAWFFLDSYTEVDLTKTNYIPFVGSLFQAFFINVGGASMLPIAKSELFPAEVKSSFSAICTMAMALASFIINKFYLIVAQWEGVYLNFLAYTICCFLVVLFVVICVPETKGRTLKEIQDILNSEILQKT